MSFQVQVKYGGEDVPGSPFKMNSNPDLEELDRADISSNPAAAGQGIFYF
jgi:hypothetical protein